MNLLSISGVAYSHKHLKTFNVFSNEYDPNKLQSFE